MNPKRYQEVKKVFLAACELDAPQVAEFLDRQCAEDPELRKEVETLLRHHEPTTLNSKLPETGPAETAPLVPTQSFSTPPPPARKTDHFPSGKTIAGRYRILGPLGRGGMGEVYRADDLKLDQTVALKFLSRGRIDDPTWLALFHNEVRLARKVTHPNVNRIYDIGEADGEPFFSMEYVDGEDLASLLRRIGRLATDKAVQIARQLCAGLGAAHDQGVLHRDLKPANIMIDGHGQVRITDFGIASLATEPGKTSRLAGTPAFMAPELFQGVEPSVRSDLYSLGIVLYELVTGKEPFGGVAGNRTDRPATPTSPSAFSSDVDPALERVILRCLDRDPSRRPESTYAIAAALPGGDPLAAALAAGETPSPSMVAAADAGAGFSPKMAAACLAIGLIGLIAVVLLANITFFLPQAGLDKNMPPAVLAHEAEKIIDRLGHDTTMKGRSQGFTIDRGYLDYMASSTEPRPDWDRLSTARPPAVFFWYRQGDRRLIPPAPFGEPALMRKLPAEPGMNTVRLDGKGRLLRFTATPIRSGFTKTPAEKPDWSVPFDMAGLDLGKFLEIDPVRKPPGFADEVIAWKGVYPESPELAIRVEGSATGGRVDSFEVIPPWRSGPEPSANVEESSVTPSRTFVVRSLFYITALLGGSLLAWRNLRLGRGDLRGAKRLACFVLVLALLDWLLGKRHVAVFVEEVAASYLWVARATFAAAATWICYVAMEPYIRRLWPQAMISWSRLLKGRFRDPLVGRDLLFGATVGILLTLVSQIDVLLPTWLGLPEVSPKLPGPGYDLGVLLGMRYKLGTVVGLLLTSIGFGLICLLLMLLVRVAVRVQWVAEVTFCLLLTAAFSTVSSYDTFLPWITNAMIAAGILFTLTRVGLVAAMGALFTRSMIVTSPITSDITAWYAPAGSFAIAVVALLLAAAFFTTLAGRPLFSSRLIP